MAGSRRDAVCAVHRLAEGLAGVSCPACKRSSSRSRIPAGQRAVGAGWSPSWLPSGRGSVPDRGGRSAGGAREPVAVPGTHHARDAGPQFVPRACSAALLAVVIRHGQACCRNVMLVAMLAPPEQPAVCRAPAPGHAAETSARWRGRTELSAPPASAPARSYVQPGGSCRPASDSDERPSFAFAAKGRRLPAVARRPPGHGGAAWRRCGPAPRVFEATPGRSQSPGEAAQTPRADPARRPADRRNRAAPGHGSAAVPRRRSGSRTRESSHELIAHLLSITSRCCIVLSTSG